MSEVMEGPRVLINLGIWTEKEIDELLKRAARIKGLPERIAALSEQLLGTEYGESTLIGNASHPEVLVLNLERVDCFTFIDYVEAMRLSRSFIEFKENVIKIRYQSGRVSYRRRNHFFTDWIEFNDERVFDVTPVIGGKAAERAAKTLNLKEDGAFYLEGVAPRSREFAFIPSESLDEEVLGGLRTGDYAGVYTEKSGLDVSHVGIIAKEKGMTLLRHASSLHRRVIDQDLMKYLADKPGLVVLRPKQCKV